MGDYNSELWEMENRLKYLKKLQYQLFLVFKLSFETIKHRKIVQKIHLKQILESLPMKVEQYYYDFMLDKKLFSAFCNIVNTTPYTIFLNLYMSNKNLKVEDFKKLKKQFAMLPNLYQLNLDLQQNKLQQDHYGCLRQMWRNNVKLQTLKINFRDNSLEELGIKCLAEGLKEDFQGKNLQQLELHLAATGLTKNSVQHLADNIFQIQSLNTIVITLSSKNLQRGGQNKIESEGCQILGEGLQFSKQKIKKLKINLSNCKVKDEGIEKLLQGIVHMNHLKDLSLDLKDNDITDKGIQILSDKISQMEDKLIKLNLDLGLNEFQNDKIEYLGEGIKKLKKLYFLNISLKESKNICEDSSVKFFEQILQIQSLEKVVIDLKHCNISMDALCRIGEHLEQVQADRQLPYLRNMDIQIG